MRLKHSFFAIFLAVMLILASDSIAKEIENLLSNPDFKVNTAGWELGDGNIFAIDKKETCPTGTNVAKAAIEAVGANNWNPELHSPSFALDSSKTYTYSFWAKTEPGKTKLINPSFESNDPVWAGAAGTSVTLTDQWVEYHSTAVWGNENRPVVVIHIALNNPPTHLNDLWIAHAKVYEGAFVEEKIVGEKPKAVTPGEKLASSWGSIKSR